jgi:hypothetical protein
MAYLQGGAPVKCTVWVEGESPFILKGCLVSYLLRCQGEDGGPVAQDFDMRMAAEHYAVGTASTAEQLALAVLAKGKDWKAAAMALADGIVNDRLLEAVK